MNVTPKSPYVKGLVIMVTSAWHCWEMVEALVGGAQWKEVRSLSFLPGLLHHDLLSASGPKQQGQATMDEHL
jgi:hypothetical protein